MSEQEAIVKNASDPKQVQAAGSKAKMRERLKQDEIRAVVSTRMGRRWVWQQISGYIYTTTFSESPHRSAFNEGFRAAKLEILRDVKSLGPEVMFQMEKEAVEDLERGL